MKRLTTKAISFHAPVRNIQVNVMATAGDQPKVRQEDVMDPLVAAKKPATPAPSQLKTLLRSIAEQLDDLKEARSQNLGELQQVAVELSVAIAAQLLRTRLDANEFNVGELVSEAIDRFQPSDKVIVKVNELDLAELEKVQDDLLNDLRDRADIVADEKLPRGACFVGTSDQGLFSSFENRLENVRETLLEGIHYARTERRTPINVDGTLRRFPDRRKPA